MSRLLRHITARSAFTPAACAADAILETRQITVIAIVSVGEAIPRPAKP
jgi:hypothetical protein